jgi:hypothetical protein
VNIVLRSLRKREVSKLLFPAALAIEIVIIFTKNIPPFSRVRVTSIAV